MWYSLLHIGIIFNIKRKENLILSTTQMNLEDVMLSAISQSQKDRHCMVLLIWDTKNSQIHRDSRIAISKG